MKFVIYLQCDTRYNKWMLEEIDSKPVILHTIERAKKIGEYKIICPLYECNENKKLAEILIENGIDCFFSNEERLTVRFYDSVMQINDIDAIIRVCGDQVLLDYVFFKEIIEKFDDSKDFFYCPGTAGAILPDIVSINLLEKYSAEVLKAERYFDVFKDDLKMKRLNVPVTKFVLNNRVNSFISYKYCKAVIENKLDIMQINDDLINQMSSSNCALLHSGILTSWALYDKADVPFYNMDGEANPWWAESTVNLVREKISKISNLRVFEWGSGNSTLFWSKYATKVVAIEHDKEWYEKVKKRIPSNVDLRYIELKYDGDYCRAINDEDDCFDIICIDGRDRTRCALNSLNKLSNKGIIIFDNSDRTEYKDGYDYLTANGFKRLELSGIVWGVSGAIDYTSIFYKSESNIFEL